MKNNIIIIILVFVVGGVAFGYLTQKSTSTGYLSTGTNTSNSTDAKYIYGLSQKINSIRLGTTDPDNIFANPVFRSLKENTARFDSQPSGRNNPFAAVGADQGSLGQRVQSTSSRQ